VVKRHRWWMIFVLLFAVPGFAGSPDIMLKDFNGSDSNVSEHIGKGKWVVVVAWAHDCHVCNQEIHHMVFFHNEHKDKDAIVLGVSVDGIAKKDKARQFVERHGLGFPNLIAEPEQAVMMKFGAGSFVGTPTYYIFSPGGTLLAQNVGPVTQEDIEAFMQSDAAKSALAAERG